MSDHFGKISIQSPAATNVPPPNKDKKTPRRKVAQKTQRSSIKGLPWILAFFIIFSLYSLAGFVGVPYYITQIFPGKFQQSTGLIYQPGKVHFNPLSFEYRSVDSQILAKEDNLPPLLKISTIKGRLAPLSLLRNDLVFNSLTIEELEANVTRATDNSYNFEALLQSTKKDTLEKMIDFSDLPFHFSLNNIAVSKSKIIFTDIPANKTHIVEDIQLALPTFSNFAFQADQYINPRFSATINGSPVELTGQAQMGEATNAQHQTDLSCDIKSLDVALYLEYLPFELPLEFTQGKANGKIGLKFSPDNDKGKKLAISFNLDVSDSRLVTHNGSIHAQIPQFHISGMLHPVAKQLHLKIITLTDPIISSYKNGLLANLRHTFFHADKAETVAPQNREPFIYDIDLLLVDGGKLKLFKKKTSKKSYAEWQRIQFSLKKFSSLANSQDIEAKDQGAFHLSAEQKNGSPSFSWQGKSSATDLNGIVTLNNINTGKLFNLLGIPQITKASGTADLKGQLDFSLSKNTPTFLPYNLSDTTINFQNFTVAENKKSILSASLIKFTNFTTDGEKTNFGNLTFQNGSLKLAKGKLPEFLSLFEKPKYQIENVTFNGKVILATPIHNDKKQQSLVFQEFSLQAKNLNSNKKTKNNVSIIAKTASGGSLTSQGTFVMSPFKGSFKTEFNALQPETIFPWFSGSPSLHSVKGLMEGKGTFSFPSIGFVGRLQISKGSIILTDASPYKWANTVLHGFNYTAAPFHLGVSLVEIEQLDFLWEITDEDNGPIDNFASILQSHLPTHSKKLSNKNNISISPVDIQEIILTKGTIHVEDNRVSPPWQAEITNFTGQITNIHTGKSPEKSQLDFQGNLDDLPFSTEGESHLFSTNNNGSFVFTLPDFPIASFHEQIKNQLDIDTSKGSFSLELNSNWEDVQLSSSSSFVFSNIEPESKQADSALPLALLTESGNKIAIDLSSTQTKPTARAILLESMVARFNKLIIKSSVSPLLLATGDFTDLIDNEFTQFMPGEFMLSGNGRETLSRYSALLITHPNVGLIISGHYDTAIDGEAMRQQMKGTELERVENENAAKLVKWQSDKEEFTKAFEQQQDKLRQEGKIIEKDIPPKYLHDFIPVQPHRVEIDRSMLVKLAEKRARIVYQHFMTQLTLPPGRVTIAKPGSIHPDIDMSLNGVSITLTAEINNEQMTE